MTLSIVNSVIAQETEIKMGISLSQFIEYLFAVLNSTRLKGRLDRVIPG